MCYPMLIAAGLAAAGAGANYAGQRRVNNEREDKLRAEGERQDNLQTRANAVIDQNLMQQSPTAQNQSLAETTQQRMAALGPQADYGSDAMPAASASVPVEVKSETARQMSEAIRGGRARLKAQARLGAFDQNQFDNRLALQRGQTELGQIADFSQGSSAALPGDLVGAENAGRGYRNAADMFNLGSSMFSNYGMTAQPAGSSVSPVVAGRNYTPIPQRAPVSMYQQFGGRRG